MTDLESLKKIFPHKSIKGYIVVPVDKYEGLISKSAVLEDIRAEIEAYGSIWVQYTIPGHTDKDIEQVVENVLKQAKEQVLDIIDRHIGEKEEK